MHLPRLVEQQQCQPRQLHCLLGILLLRLLMLALLLMLKLLLPLLFLAQPAWHMRWRIIG